ncbi:MAG: hypothetical protein JW801_00405, partial [Bacteroidales bacterium]|nr:hypothetical protein [Bacteroidales bacterium]
MMTKFLLHIGYPRTGTTWLQTQVFPLVQNYSFLDRKYVQEYIIHPSPAQFSPVPIQSLIGKLPIIISEEMISGRFHGGSINLLIMNEMMSRLKKVS